MGMSRIGILIFEYSVTFSIEYSNIRSVIIRWNIVVIGNLYQGKTQTVVLNVQYQTHIDVLDPT